MRSCHYLILAVLLAIISGTSVQAETSNELYEKAVELQSEEKYEEALETINKAIDLDPKPFELYKLNYIKAELLEQLEQYEEEIAAIDEVLAYDPENADMFTSKAIALKKLERYEDAIDIFEKATLLYQKKQKYCGIPAGTSTN